MLHAAGTRRSVQAEYLPVIKAKQRTAFPPNYIHSLDSAHMMLTASACHKAGACHVPAAAPAGHVTCAPRPAAGITFAGVHDSFWTHAGSVDDMNRILRDTVRSASQARPVHAG